MPLPASIDTNPWLVYIFRPPSQPRRHPVPMYQYSAPFALRTNTLNTRRSGSTISILTCTNHTWTTKATFINTPKSYGTKHESACTSIRHFSRLWTSLWCEDTGKPPIFPIPVQDRCRCYFPLLRWLVVVNGVFRRFQLLVAHYLSLVSLLPRNPHVFMARKPLYLRYYLPLVFNRGELSLIISEDLERSPGPITILKAPSARTPD